MNDEAKIGLSEPELSMVQDSTWILTKQNITQKVFHLFSQQTGVINAAFSQSACIFNEEVRGSMPKIYKGENYRQLPYVMFDYPAVFGREDIFALRTMFWWGNHFSVVLFLSGKYKREYEQTITAGLKRSTAPFYTCVGDDPWEHHFETDNFIPVNGDENFEDRDFIKLGLRWNLDQWNRMPLLLEEGYRQVIELFSA